MQGAAGMDRRLARGGAVAALLLLSALLSMLVALPAVALVIPLREVPPSISTAGGTVEISSDNGTTWKPADPGTYVSSGILLRTGPDGTCVLDFSDHTVLALQPLTTITMLPDDRTQRFLLSTGRVWVQFDSLTSGDRNGVTAPHLMVSATEPCTFVLDSDQDGAEVKVLDGRVDLSSDTGRYVSALSAGEALIATTSGYSLPTGFDVAAERAVWEPLVAGATTTSIPGETTRTSTGRTTSTLAGTGTSRTLPPGEGSGDNGSGTSGWTRWGIVLIVVAVFLFLALMAVATILLVVLRRRRPPYPPAPGAQHLGYGPPPTFCRHCGAALTPGARFCRACGKPN